MGMKLYTTSMNIDSKYLQQGYRFIAGADEAGRGAWAGPLVAAAVIMPDQAAYKKIPGVTDSKQLSHTQRKKLFPKIVQTALSCVVVCVNQTEIDQLGVHQANIFALSYALTHLEPAPDIALIDGFQLNHFLPTVRVIHGDTISYTIGAASIVAKVVRDFLMSGIDQIDPRYQFARHKGYGTALHQVALHTYGVNRWHRQSFAPIQQLRYT